jgi:hypothetical protein
LVGALSSTSSADRSSARLAGLTEALRERAELPLSGQDRLWWEQQMRRAQEAADPAAWTADHEAGRALTAAQGFAEALRDR